jgi:catechol 2,3-dioxygenase-like lactoylglutathione lyase family enzyme
MKIVRGSSTGTFNAQLHCLGIRTQIRKCSMPLWADLAMQSVPKLRVARPSNDLAALLTFYRDGLGLDVLFSFENHDGFDGVMLGREGAPYHLEFTRAHGHPAGRAPTQDNLLVFYLPDPDEWATALNRMRGKGFEPVPAFNPYWDRNGCTFEDPDGYRIVLQKETWSR